MVPYGAVWEEEWQSSFMLLSLFGFFNVIITNTSNNTTSF